MNSNLRLFIFVTVLLADLHIVNCRYSLANDQVNGATILTVTGSMGTSAAGDCIIVEIPSGANIWGSSNYIPFTTTTSFAVTSGQSATASIPRSATAIGQQFQIKINSAPSSQSYTFQIPFNTGFAAKRLQLKTSLQKGCVSTGAFTTMIDDRVSFTAGSISTASIVLSTSVKTIGDQDGILNVMFNVGTKLRTSGSIVIEYPMIDSNTAALDCDTFAPQVSSLTTSGAKFITITGRTCDPTIRKLTITYTATSIITAGQSIYLSITNFYSPVNYDVITGYKVTTQYEYNSIVGTVDDTASYVTFNPVTQGYTFLTFKSTGSVTLMDASTSLADYTIGKANRKISFNMDVELPFQSPCLLKITFPEDIKINIDETLSTTSVTGTDFMASPTISQVNNYGSGNSVIISGCTSAVTGYDNTATITLQNIVSPGQLKDVKDFVLQIARTVADFSNNKILVQGGSTQGFMISKSQLQGQSITLTSFLPTSSPYTIAQNQIQYQAKFKVTTNLYSDSIIEITIPSALTSLSSTFTTTASCQVELVPITGVIYITDPVNTGLVCSGNGNVLTIKNAFKTGSSANWDYTVSQENNIIVTFNGAINPNSARSAGDWKVVTKNWIQSAYYQVDLGTSTTSFTTVPGSLTAGSSSLSIQDSSTVTTATTSFDSSIYTFTIGLEHMVPDKGFVIITLPSSGDVSIASPSMIRSSCLYLATPTSTGSQQTCSISGSQISMQLQQAHSSTTNPITIQLQGFRNPRTLKNAGSFTIYTQDSQSNKIDDNGSANFNVQMNTVATFSDLSAIATNLTNGAITNYIISFVSPVPLANGDKLEMTFDSNIKPQATFGGQNIACNGIQSVSGPLCSYYSGKLYVTFTSTNGQVGTYSFNLSTVQNPPSTRIYEVITSVIVRDSTGNQLMSFARTSSKPVALQTQLAANILTYSLTQDNTDYSSKSKYRISFKTTNGISSTGSVMITWPIQIGMSNNPTCVVKTQASQSGTCNFNSVTRSLIISNAFGSASSTVPYTGTIDIEIDSLINPADNRVLNGFLIATFDDNSQAYKIDKLEDNLLFPQTPCNFPCKACSSNDKNYCSSCWSDIGSPYLMQVSGSATCKQSCDSGYSSNGNSNKVCTRCDQSCSQCVDSGLNGDKFRCISCAKGYDFKYTPLQKCMQSCNQGFYQSSPYICNLCNANCKTCDKSATNCTSCNINNPQYRYLYDFQCIENCPTGFTNVGAECLKCDSKCSTCKNTTSTCTSCDTSTKYKYFFGFQCLDTCPEGTNPDKQRLTCFGCLKGCKMCDNLNQTKCLECISPLLEYKGTCVTSCPSGTSKSLFGQTCTSSFFFNFPTIPYPHLIACGAMTIICLISLLKDRRSLLLTNIIVLWGPVEFVSYFSQTGLSVLYSTYKFAGTSGFAFVTYIILNIAFALAFEYKIARKDAEYMEWRNHYGKTSKTIIILSAIFSFKILRLHYSYFFGFDCFKAQFQYPGVFQRQIIIFTIVHFIFSNCLIIGVDVVGLLYTAWDTQLNITMIETGLMGIVLIILDFIELCKLKHYLGEDQRVDYDALLYAMNESMDKKLRQDMLKQIMNHVRGNKDLNLNNRLDDLLNEHGPRRCKSMTEFGNLLEDDPRLTRSCPHSPRDQNDDFFFDKDAPLPTLDNVYAESRPADPLGKLGKTYSDFDSQVFPKDFDKILSRKGGDFANFEDQTMDYNSKRTRKSKARGRKNQYYTQIDAEDDEEAENLGDDHFGDEGRENLDIIKEEDDEGGEENLRKRKEKKQKTLKAAAAPMSPQLKAQPANDEAKQSTAQKEAEEKQRKLQEQMQLQEKLKQEKLQREKEEREHLEREREKKLQEEQMKAAAEQKRIEDEILKRREEEERLRRQELERKRIEDERLRVAEEERKLKQAAELEREILQKQEEERLEREREEQLKKLKEEADAKKLEEDIAAASRARQAQEEEAKQLLQQNQSVDNQEIIMNNDENLLQAFQRDEPVVQVPPDSQKRNFNENDILGEFDRDEKGNVILLQDENGKNVDKLGRLVNERGYLQDPMTGDIVENYQNKKMFDQKDIDERGEVPAPYCVEKYNFNPFMVRGEFDLDRQGRPLLQKRGNDLVDKKGRVVNKKGWLIDKDGHICDQNGRKKFDKKQMTPEGDFPRLFNLNGRRFDIADLCGQLQRDQNGNFLFKKNKKGQNVDDMGRLVNEKGYLIDENGNIIDKEKKKMFEKKYLRNGEFPKIFPFTKFNIKRIQGDFEMDPLGNPILDKLPNGDLVDRQGKRVNQKGYFVDSQGNIIDMNGKMMFEKEILDAEGDIPKVFRTGLLKSDTGSSLSRLMSEIDKNQPSEYGNPQWRRAQQQEQLRKQQQERKMLENEAEERLSGNTSVDSMMEDTPSNYNIANQRFDQTNSMLNAKTLQLQQQKQNQQKGSSKAFDQVDEEDSQYNGGEYGGMGMLNITGNDMKKRRIKKKKKPVQVFGEPSDKDIMMAKAYGGVPKAAPKRSIINKTQNRDIHTPVSGINQRASKQMTSGMLQGGDQSSVKHDGNNTASHKGEAASKTHQTNFNNLNESNEASFLAIPEHHLREQRLKQKKMSELRNRNGKMKKRQTGDPDFERMFGKDIDEFLEDSDWDIESFENQSNFSKGTSRSAFNQDGRIRGLESIYLQRIETSMKKGPQGLGQPSSKKATTKKSQAKFRPMQDRFVNDPALMLQDGSNPDILHPPQLDGQLSSISASRMQRPMFVESANTTSLQMQRPPGGGGDQNLSRAAIPKPTQTQYRNGPIGRGNI